MNKPDLTWLKIAALVEGTSLIALVFIAVPFKRLLDMPILVKIIGPVHGALFLLFISALVFHFIKGRIDGHLTGIGALASLIPFGTYIYKVRPQHNPPFRARMCASPQTPVLGAPEAVIL
ncbi:MAG: hypothetical protein COB39_02230 [Marinosulfonomonas sp.]|nr:MAG: hypothetical protein COB39_02230 [Marinosulfonomonas sp.]